MSVKNTKSNQLYVWCQFFFYLETGFIFRYFCVAVVNAKNDICRNCQAVFGHQTKCYNCMTLLSENVLNAGYDVTEILTILWVFKK